MVRAAWILRIKFIFYTGLLLCLLWYHRVEDNPCELKLKQRQARSRSSTGSFLNQKASIPPNVNRWLPYYKRSGSNNGTDIPRILFWTRVYGDWYLGLPEWGTDSLAYYAGPHKCYIANDRSALAISDAVVFYGRDLNLADMPVIRAQGQKWVYWSLEPPNHCSSNALRYLNNTFNWTMTYRHDSENMNFYGRVLRLDKPVDYSTEALRKKWERKDTMAVWPVSNCETFGKREDYIEDLRKYMTVDIYGKCGNYTCVSDWRGSCHRKFELRYFFYLSFENAICKDYVTEKLYIALNFDMIPVVFGGANYSELAPPGSYIDALSFKTPKDLAEYLNVVANIFVVYKRYFAWRKEYIVKNWDGFDFIDLCRNLHSESFRRSTVYESIHHWWNTSSHCRAWDRNTNQVYE